MKKISINSIIFYTLLILLFSPFLSVVIFSFINFGYGEIQIGTLVGYRELFENSFRFNSIYSILVRAFINASLAVIIALPFSYFLIKKLKIRFRVIILIILTLPFLVNEATRVYSWNFILGGQGIIYRIIQSINPTADPISWLSNSEFSVRLVMLSASIPFAVFVLTLVLSNIRKHFWLASQDLGANNFFEFFKVIIPLSKVGLVSAWSLVFLFSLSMSTEVFFLGGASKHSLRIMINDLLSASKISAVMALGTIFLIFIVLFFSLVLFTQKLLTKKRL